MANRKSPAWDLESQTSGMNRSDVFLAVARALRGDRQGARSVVERVRSGVESQVRGGQVAAVRASEQIGAPFEGARICAPLPLPRVASLAKVTICLPDGRRMQVVQTPAPARHHDMLGIAHVTDTNVKRAFSGIAHNGRAIDQLAHSQQLLAERVTKLQSDGDLPLLRGMVEGLAVLEARLRRIERVQQRRLTAQTRATRTAIAGVNQALRSQARAMNVQKFHEAVASVQSVALATKGNLLTSENVLLAANQLGWSFASDLLQSVLGGKPVAATLSASAAVLANLATSRAIIPRKRG